ncbi:hypothetical protein BDZ45DRAFT_808436 [Acephala macrosclerotiorum]|nr:hypothetical protein BDZ45DRAFT_808436 [Acephala macrosclerotiorum]
MPLRFVEPAQRARGRTMTIQRRNNHHTNPQTAKASIALVAENKPIAPPSAPPAPPNPIPVPPRLAQPISTDGAMRAKAHLYSARGEEHSAFLDFVDEVLSCDAAKPLITFAGNADKAFKWLTHEELHPEQYANKPKIISQNTPLDVFLTILDQLDEATSTSLGLTCHSFYELHKLRYPQGTSLQAQTALSGTSEQLYLYEILRSWMPKDLHYFAVNNFSDGKYMTKQRCLEKVLEKNKGVHRFNKMGCWGIWDEEQEVAALQYGAYQEVVFRLCHDKVKIKERGEYGGFKWQRALETPKRPWVKFGLTDASDWRQTPRFLR